LSAYDCCGPVLSLKLKLLKLVINIMNLDKSNYKLFEHVLFEIIRFKNGYTSTKCLVKSK